MGSGKSIGCGADGWGVRMFLLEGVEDGGVVWVMDAFGHDVANGLAEGSICHQSSEAGLETRFL
jgi:hypothetical protein